MQTGHKTDRVELDDKRLISFASWGDPGGFPILAFHGIPGSRLTFSFASEMAKRYGLRLVSPDRPGIGGSTPHPNRQIVDWPNDVQQLVDRLGIERFAVIGLSGGGPYGLAVANRLASRVVATAIVSGMGPVDDPWLLEHASSHQKLRLHLFRDVPGFIPVLAAVAGFALKRLSDRQLSRLLNRVPEPGRAILGDERVASQLFNSLREGFSQGSAAMARDLKLMTRPWGFRLEDIPGPVLLWHGDADFDVPVILGKAVARRLPRCEARFVPHQGHVWVLEHFEEVLIGLSRRIEVTCR